MNELDRLVSQLKSAPFLFIGSGLTKRYYNLPDWNGLLKEFASRLGEDVAIYSKYVNKAKNNGNGDLPSIASAIEKDFNERWFDDTDFRYLSSENIQYVSDNNISPFKAEIANYIKQKSNTILSYCDEIDLFKQISDKHITGIITTNYDCFLEEATGFETYVGQNELIFSDVQGIAEIYKIHGSITQPDSILINADDYKAFEQKSKYLAAKLMTIFMEYPIIFMGYSISDTNIQNVLKSIVECMPDNKRKLLEKNFIFIEYNKDMLPSDINVSPYTMAIDGIILNMTKVSLSNYALLYKAISHKKAGLPAKLLRMFKKEFYAYTLTNTPSDKIKVAAVDDNRIDDEELVLAICKPDSIGLQGLTGITADDWYVDVVLENLKYNSDEMLSNSYPRLSKSCELPIYKYLSKAKKSYTDIAIKKSFDEFISATYIKSRHKRVKTHRSIPGVIELYKGDDCKIMEHLAYLEEHEINIEQLEKYLREFLLSNHNFFQNSKGAFKSHVRRMIRIYDWLKYGKKKVLP